MMPKAGGRKVYGFYICNLRMSEAFEGRAASWYEGLLYGSLWHTKLRQRPVHYFELRDNDAAREFSKPLRSKNEALSGFAVVKLKQTSQQTIPPKQTHIVHSSH